MQACMQNDIIIIRKAGEICKLYELPNRNIDYVTSDIIKSDYKNIKYGDIVYLPDGYRSTSAFIYLDDNIFECIADFGAFTGSGGIPHEISQHIENPITFFASIPMINMSSFVMWIDLDIDMHLNLLREFCYVCLNKTNIDHFDIFANHIKFQSICYRRDYECHFHMFNNIYKTNNICGHSDNDCIYNLTHIINITYLDLDTLTIGKRTLLCPIE